MNTWISVWNSAWAAVGTALLLAGNTSAQELDSRICGLKFHPLSEQSVQSDLLSPFVRQPGFLDWWIDFDEKLRAGRIPTIPPEFADEMRQQLASQADTIRKVEVAVASVYNNSRFTKKLEDTIVRIPDVRTATGWTDWIGLRQHIAIGALCALEDDDMESVVRHLRLGYRLNEIDIKFCFDGDSVSSYAEAQTQLFAIHTAAYSRLSPDLARTLKYDSVLPAGSSFLKIAGIEALRLEMLFEEAQGDAREAEHLRDGCLVTEDLFTGGEAWTDQQSVDIVGARLNAVAKKRGRSPLVYNVWALARTRRSFNCSRMTARVLVKITDAVAQKDIAEVRKAVSQESGERQFSVVDEDDGVFLIGKGQALKLSEDNPFVFPPPFNEGLEPPLAWKVRLWDHEG